MWNIWDNLKNQCASTQIIHSFRLWPPKWYAAMRFRLSISWRQCQKYVGHDVFQLLYLLLSSNGDWFWRLKYLNTWPSRLDPKRAFAGAVIRSPSIEQALDSGDMGSDEPYSCAKCLCCVALRFNFVCFHQLQRRVGASSSSSINVELLAFSLDFFFFFQCKYRLRRVCCHIFSTAGVLCV